MVNQIVSKGENMLKDIRNMQLPIKIFVMIGFVGWIFNDVRNRAVPDWEFATGTSFVGLIFLYWLFFGLQKTKKEDEPKEDE